MTIRKIWRRLALVSTAFFWASCDDGGTEPIFNPSISDASSSAMAPGSSSAEPESSSSSMFERSSSSEKVDACQDTQKYKYTVASTGLRCGPLEKIFTSKDMLTFECCDGSRIETGDPTTGMSAESCFLPTNSKTPGCLVNDSLFTPAEKEAREKAAKLAEYNKTYCKENGGVKDFRTYCPDNYTVSSSECFYRASKTAKEHLQDSLGLSEAMEECIEYMINPPAVYGVMPSYSSCTRELASVICDDETEVESTGFQKAKTSYEKRLEDCKNAGSAELIEEIKSVCSDELGFYEEEDF